MRSLVWTLQALDARILAQVPVYGIGEKIGPDGEVLDEELLAILGEIRSLLKEG